MDFHLVTWFDAEMSQTVEPTEFSLHATTFWKKKTLSLLTKAKFQTPSRTYFGGFYLCTHSDVTLKGVSGAIIRGFYNHRK